MRFHTRRRRLAAAALVPALALAAPALVGAAPKHKSGGSTVYAKRVARVLPQGSEPVLLEGGAFGPAASSTSPTSSPNRGSRRSSS